MNLKRKGTALPGLGKCVMTGTGVAVCMSLAISMVITTMLNCEKITEAGMGYGVLAMLLMASYSGGYTACKLRKEQRLSSSLLTGAMYFVILAAVTILFFDGRFRGVGESVLLIVCGCTLAAMWTSRRNKGGKMRKFKFSNG